MKRRFDGVAFDLDGTLYPNYQLYIRLIPFIWKEHRLLRALGKARDILRVVAGEQASLAEEDDFYTRQARLIGDILHLDPETAQQRVEQLIYRGWEPLFKKIKLYPDVRETLVGLREQGIKLGLLSDFPPDVKLENLNLAGIWDTVLCSEQIGRLKPDPAPFGELAKQLDSTVDRILYVGNSVAYDIVGAKKVGMKAALITAPFVPIRTQGSHTRNADFVCTRYRQLYDYVLS
jgi:putative hydrolase of the HAD superfamily